MLFLLIQIGSLFKDKMVFADVDTDAVASQNLVGEVSDPTSLFMTATFYVRMLLDQDPTQV